MPPETYRYYRLDSAGQLHDAEWFQAESDGNAIAQVLARFPDGKSEIWHANRLVAQLAPSRRRA